MLGKDGEVNMSVNVVCLSNGQVLKRVMVLMVPGEPVDESPVGKADKLVLNPPVLFIVLTRAGTWFIEGPGTVQEVKRCRVISPTVKMIDVMDTLDSSLTDRIEVHCFTCLFLIGDCYSLHL